MTIACRASKVRSVLKMSVTLIVGACTYASPEILVRIANHATLTGSDSVAIAVYAARIHRPTGVAALPDGGSPRLTDERAVFYLCFPGDGSTQRLEPIAVLQRPDSLVSSFTPWASNWDSQASVLVSLRGYTTAESRTDAFRILWYRLHLSGEVERLIDPKLTPGPATSLPEACEVAALASARRLLGADSTK